MKRIFSLSWTQILLIVFTVSIWGSPLHASAAKLVKTHLQSTVYYLDDRGMRHTYPSFPVFASWFPNGNNTIEKITADELAAVPLGQNVTFRPGALVKIPSNPQVYAVEPGGILRPIVSEQTARNLYGNNWAAAVADVPEVFFSDYKIGASVRGRADLADGTLAKLEGNANKWYYKDKGVLTAFSDDKALRENNLVLSRAATIPQVFPIRSRTITGRETRITDPQWGTPLNSADCAADNLTASVLYLSRGSSNAVEKINTWRTGLASTWERRTDVLSLIAMNPVEEGVLADRLLIEGKLDVQEIARTYFDAHADEVDFIFIWNAVVPVSSAEIAEYWPVTNITEGLGKPLFERNGLYGSRGKLKGVIHMGRPGDYPLDDPAGMKRAIETGLHELLHQWSGEADFRDATGADRTELQTADTLHWSPLVDFISPLGGWGWQKNDDGTFTSKRSLITPSLMADLHFPDLDLYLMGLLPRHSVAPLQYLQIKAGEQVTSTMVGTMRTVTIDDIVYGNGVRRCTITNQK